MRDRFESQSEEWKVKGYRATAFLADVESRTMNVDFAWENHDHLRERGNASLALGAFRTGLMAAVILAATPAKNRDLAEMKIEALRHARNWLGEKATELDRINAIPMLAAAEMVEAGVWGLGEVRRVPKRRGMLTTADDELSPPLLHHYATIADQSDLDAATRRVASVEADYQDLWRRGDTQAARGAVYDLLTALLWVMATPASSVAQIDVKREMLDEYWDLLEPTAFLLGPMVEVVLMDDCRRVGAPPDRIEAIRSVLPGKTGRSQAAP